MDSQRLEELFRYFQATSDAVTAKQYDVDSPLGYQPEHASISSDPVLNALTQLGACRMNADRAFVSLIDQEHQFVVAEMTTSISMFDSTHHAQDHGVCIGVRSLDLYAGICAGTMPAFTSDLPEDRPFIASDNVFADSSRYVINDLSLEDKYAERPYVTGYPHMRYYAEVPIKSPSGFVLGTYAVLDNKPRKGLEAEHYRILHETSMAIMQHLEMIKLREEHDHAKRLLQGLNAFVQDGPGSSKATILRNELNRRPGGGTPSRGTPKKPAVYHNASNITDDVSISEVPKTSKPVDRSSDTVVSDHSHPSNPVKIKSFARNQPSVTEESSLTFTKSSEESDLTTTLAEDNSQNVANVPLEDANGVARTADTRGALFTYAANILRSTMNLEGVVFLDPAPSHVTFYDPIVTEQATTAGAHSMMQTEGLEIPSNTEIIAPAVTRSLRQVNDKSLRSQTRFSKNFGFSIKHSNCAASLPESIHKELLELCSSGQVFNLTTTSHTTSPSLKPAECTDGSKNLKISPTRIEEIESIIRWYIPAARSIMFVPLWNPHTGKWFAGGLGWSTQYKRVLTSSDISYFVAFGNILMAEVARLELLAIDRAKSDFISCMSHELRSPLHGILGSTELLLDSVTDNDQRQYVSMIDKCGRILLETMENILQFSKINRGISETKITGERVPNGSEPNDTVARVSGEESNLDLSALIEETCEVLVAGKTGVTHISTSNHSQLDEAKSLSDSSATADPSSDKVITVILQIDSKCSRLIRSSSAAWRRCLLNLLGNSLKYTETGYIHVKLIQATVADDSILTPSQSIISLIVRDTGRGIGRTYLESRLFRPFEQENTFSSGTGLGLSIVKSLVDDLNGSVDIQSEIGIGTEVALSIPVGLAHEVNDTEKIIHSPIGLKICLLGFGTKNSSETLSSEIDSVTFNRNMMIETSLETHCYQWLGMTCFRADNVTDAKAEIIAVLECNLHLLQNKMDPGTIIVPANCSLLVLCSDHHIHDHSTDHEQKGRVAFIAQPFGPRKLVSTIEDFHQLRTTENSKVEEQIEIGLSNLQSTLDRQRSNTKKRGSISPPVPPPVPISERTQPVHTPRDQADSMGHRTSPQPLVQIQKRNLKHLLLVDDNPINLKLLTQLVRKVNCTYEVATNGLEALNIYKTTSKRFDFIFMDISMPVMDGFESTQAIRAFESEENRSSTHIVAMTGLGSEDARNKAASSGFSMFWTKPVKMKDIKTLVEAGDGQKVSQS